MDYTLYVCFAETEREAHFVQAFLNSSYANLAIKGFQARGLFGPRHVSKKILDVPWPKFSENLPSHQQLTELSQQAAQQVQSILGNAQDLVLDPRTLGRLRSSIRKELAPVMAQIDRLVEAISSAKDRHPGRRLGR